MLAEVQTITVQDIDVSITSGITPATAPVALGATPSSPVAADTELSTVEREHILRTITEAGGNKARAAKKLGISRRAFVPAPRATWARAAGFAVTPTARTPVLETRIDQGRAAKIVVSGVRAPRHRVGRAQFR
jgi:hypothetical protein